MRPLLIGLSLVGVVGVCPAATYLVSNTNNTGSGSLRRAIQTANAHPGADVIHFTLADGAVIRPTTPLPVVTGQLAIDTQPTATGRPRICLYAAHGATGSGLVIRASLCGVRGLVIAGFPVSQLSLESVTGCEVLDCYFGLDASGSPRTAGQQGLYLGAGSDNVIGGTGLQDRNVFSSGSMAGVYISSSSRNTIRGNYFGLKPDGVTPLGDRRAGVEITAGMAACSGNRVRNNVFGGLVCGVILHGADGTEITGNLLGLGADGSTLVSTSTAGVYLDSGASGTRIGGNTAALRNVFAGAANAGIAINGPNCPGNCIQGNYFGTNRAGSETRTILTGVRVSGGAGAQLIGGSTASVGNHFTCLGTEAYGGTGLTVYGPGLVRVRHNRFGVLPAGGDAAGMSAAIHVYAGGEARVTDNLIARQSLQGLYVSDLTWDDGLQTEVSAYTNVFRNCEQAVSVVGEALCHLGNLGNEAVSDDGANDFQATNRWFISNATALAVKAEGNDFHTTDSAEIAAKVFDHQDCPESGVVDYIPYVGMGSGPARELVVTAAATPTRGGAEVVCTLSAPAEVTLQVLNLAGRLVAVPVATATLPAGTHRLPCGGRSLGGTRLPAGRYLLRLLARGTGGQQAGALCGVELP